MATIIRRSPDLLGGKYFCAGAIGRHVVSARDARKLLYLDSSNFGNILSTTSVAANPGAVCFLTDTVHCICEDGYLRKFTLSTDTLSAVVSTVNAYTQVSTWIFTHGNNFVCPWGWDGVQIMTHAGTALITQRGSGLSKIQNAYLNGNRLYCFDGIGKGVVLTLSASNVIVGEKFTVPSGTNVDCIGLVDATTLGIGANTNPQYITLSLADPDAPVWASRTLESAAIGSVVADGPLISTDISPLSSDAGAYAVNGGTQFNVAIGVPSVHIVSVNGAITSDGNGVDSSFVCSGSALGGQLLAHWPAETNKTAIAGADPVDIDFPPSGGTWSPGSEFGRLCYVGTAGYTYPRYIPSALVRAKGYSVTMQVSESTSVDFAYIQLNAQTPNVELLWLYQINSTTWELRAKGVATTQFSYGRLPVGWSHLAVTYDSRGGGVACAYINGSLVHTSPVVPLACVDLYMIGQGPLNFALYGGATKSCAKDYRIYSLALTADDVLAIYNEDNS